MEASRILGTLRATWHDLYETKELHGFHTRRSASWQSACGVARGGQSCGFTHRRSALDSPSVLQAYCYPSSSRGEGKERENVLPW